MTFRLAVMAEFGLTWSETGRLSLGEVRTFAPLLEERHAEREREERNARSASRAPRGMTPVMT